MKILSVNISKPVEVIYNKRIITTGIFKKPVEGPLYASKQNLAGDGQADLKNHGGLYKAIYAYSYDHYGYWSRNLNRQDFEFGQFGENLTVAGLDESKLCIGDQLQTGGVELMITQPRVPCFKLGIKFGDRQMPKKFQASALTGFYMKVLQEGYVQAGDVIKIVKRDENQISVKNLFEAFYISKEESALTILQKSMEVKDLSPSWKAQIEKRLSSG
jgi:MOSC domain-containing protein YiiM